MAVVVEGGVAVVVEGGVAVVVEGGVAPRGANLALLYHRYF